VRLADRALAEAQGLHGHRAVGRSGRRSEGVMDAQVQQPPAGSSSKKMVAIVVTLALTSLFIYVVVAAFKRGPAAVHEVPFMLAGKPAPPFKMKRLDTGQEVEMK